MCSGFKGLRVLVQGVGFKGLGFTGSPKGPSAHNGVAFLPDPNTIIRMVRGCVLGLLGAPDN